MGTAMVGSHGKSRCRLLSAGPEFLPLEQSPALIDLQKRIKTVFDPHNIMNPGKIFWAVGH